MAQYVVNGIVQAIVAVILASAFYLGHVFLARARGSQRQSWSRWLGLHAPPNGRDAWIFFAAFLGIGAVMALVTRFLLPGCQEMAAQTPQHAIATLPLTGLAVAAPMYAFVQTGFSEELIFRGVLAKRLIQWMGMRWGNLAQGYCQVNEGPGKVRR